MNNMDFRRADPPLPGAALAVATDRNGRISRLPLMAMVTQYLTTALRRRWLILGAIITALTVAIVVTVLMTPEYTARTTLEIQREGENIVRVQGVEPETGLADMEFYQTQYGLLQSQALAERVATDLRLFDDVRFFEMYGAREAGEWFEDGRLRPGASTRDQRVRKAADILQLNLGVTPVRLSRLVHVSYTSPDPAFSMRVVNAWGERFIRTSLERRFEATSYARNFLEQRLEQLRQRLDESERQLVGYASREGIINLPANPAFGAGERPMVADDLATLNRELSQATADRVTAESRLGSPGAAVNESLQNQAISGLRQRRAEAEAEYAQMMVQFEPQYPPALALRQEIDQLDQAIAREEARVRATIRENYEASAAREARLSRQVDRLKGDLLDVRRRSIQYNIYQREVDTNRQLYDALLQRYKEIGVAGGVGRNNISVVDRANIPQEPSSPKVVLNLLLALIIGSGAGFLLALVVEQFDDAVSDPSQVSGKLGVPLLGIVPKTKGGDPTDMIEDRKSEVSEAYLSIQTSLGFSTDHGAPRSLAVTSTRPGEGKSTTALAIARSLSRTGKKVLLIDGDMRAPSLHHIADVDNARGFSNYLAGDDDLAALIRAVPGWEMDILTSGPQPPSAAELLSSPRLVTLLGELLSHYDHVVIDAPPVMGLADAPLLTSKTEGTVFVVESGSTRLGQSRTAVARLASAQAMIVGAVLTKYDARSTAYGYGYDYGYGYGREPEATA